jgi:hypothetical protein
MFTEGTEHKGTGHEGFFFYFISSEGKVVSINAILVNPQKEKRGTAPLISRLGAG